MEVTSPTPGGELDDDDMMMESPIAMNRQHSSAADLQRSLLEYVN